MATVGSRGDVQPYLVLALELRSRGHTVSVATEERLKPLVDEVPRNRRILACTRVGDD